MTLSRPHDQDLKAPSRASRVIGPPAERASHASRHTRQRLGGAGVNRRWIAGSGYDTLRLTKVVGPKGRVFAEDVTPAYLQQLRRTVSAAGLKNVEVVQGTAGDSRLPLRSIDAAVMVHMYHEVQEPMALLASLARAFKPGGRLGIEELDRATGAHGTPPKLLTCELAAAGYRLIDLQPLAGDIGYFAVFASPAAANLSAATAAKRCRG